MPPLAQGPKFQVSLEQLPQKLSPIHLQSLLNLGVSPRIKITDLLVEVDEWTGFTRHFTSLRNDEVVKDRELLLTAILADGINLGLTRMAEDVGLNKGEARHALAKVVFFNRLGELRDRTHENQRHRTSGLNLVVAAIVLWNTVYLERAIAALRERGQAIPDELLAHLSPLKWEHINLTGDYHWRRMEASRTAS